MSELVTGLVGCNGADVFTEVGKRLRVVCNGQEKRHTEQKQAETERRHQKKSCL